MINVGTLRILKKEKKWCTIRWTVNDFLKLTREDHILNSKHFCIKHGTFSLRISSSFSTEKDEIEVYLRCVHGNRSPSQFFWKLSVENSDDRIPTDAKGEEQMHSCNRLLLGPLQNMKRFLYPNGSLVVLCNLCFRREGTAVTPSLPTQHPVERALKMSTQPVKSESAADGTNKSSLSKSMEGNHDAHLSTRKYGTLKQQAVFCIRNTWIVPNFRKLAERETYFYSDKFCFGSRLWQLCLSLRPDQPKAGKEGDVLLSLLDVSGHEISYPLMWRLLTEDGAGMILKSSGGKCKDVNDIWEATLPLGPPVDVQQFLDFDGVLRVACELCLLKETKNASSQAESKDRIDLLARDYGKLLSSAEAADVTIRVKGQREFLVHKAILTARTPVFSSMLQRQMSESENSVMDIKDCDPDIFQHFLHFVYTGSIDVLSQANAIEMYRVADKYQMDELKLQCLECIKGGLSIQSFGPTISLAIQYCETQLTERATEFFADNVDGIVLTTEWQEFLCKNPIKANELFVKALQKKNSLVEQTPPAKRRKMVVV